tara:strand:+ start:54 stop:263 length:210 start_codon:yes stop_codon:yes gene_type:complete
MADQVAPHLELEEQLLQSEILYLTVAEAEALLMIQLLQHHFQVHLYGYLMEDQVVERITKVLHLPNQIQ